MSSFKVRWEIDIEIETNDVFKAATEALDIQRDLDSIATVFTVVDEKGNVFTVDLDDGYRAANDKM